MIARPVTTLFEKAKKMFGFSAKHTAEEETHRRYRQEKSLEQLLKQAEDLGCEIFIQQKMAWAEEKIKTFLVRVAYLLNEARGCGLDEAQVKELISYGNLQAVERLLASKKEEIEFLELKQKLQTRIDLLPLAYRPPRQKMLAMLSDKELGSRSYHKALHELEMSLKACKV